MSLSKDEKPKSSRKFNLGLYRASVDGMLFMLKSMLILNSGALVSILVAVSRSVTEGFASAIIGSADNFLWGLIFALIAMLFFAPTAEGIEEFEEYNKKVRPLSVISAFSLLISCGFFIFGTWSTVSALEEFFHTE